MTLARRLLSWLPCMTISNAGAPYLRRYTLLWTPLFRIYIHEILKSDEDRALHDHPWPFVSFILRGGYVEHRPAGARWCWPGRVIVHRAADLHRIELRKIMSGIYGYVLPVEIPAWTLVLCGPKCRKWGFMTPLGWLDADEYARIMERPSLASPVEMMREGGPQ